VKNSLTRTNPEIESIRKACLITDKGFIFVLKEIKSGITEKALAKRLSNFLRNNSNGLSFRTIVGFGENSSHIHHRPTNRRLKAGDAILLDFGAKINGFCSDLSRTVFFKKATKKQIQAYNLVSQAQEKAIKFIQDKLEKNAKIKCKDVDKIAREYLVSKRFPAIPHGLGHALGKKVHQAPRFSPKSKHYLKPGMILTVEPGIYLKTFGIRIEDDILIKENRVEILTKSSKKVIIL
jgi:Xaa-Pro aminopeptidase